MTMARHMQNAFSSGEIDPLLWFRQDYQRFQTGARTFNGFLPLRQGGATRAPGTVSRGTTRNNQVARFIDFAFAVNDVLTLEFTGGFMRVWRYNVLVETGGAPYELAIPYLEADLPNLQWRQSKDAIYIADGRNPIKKLSRLALDNWTIEDFDPENGPFQVQNLDEGLAVQVSGVADDAPAWSTNENLSVGTRRQFGQNVYEFLGPAGTVGDVAPGHIGGDQTYQYQSGSGSDGPVFSTVSWRWHYTLGDGEEVTLTASDDLFVADHVGMLMRLEPTDYSAIPIWVGNISVNIGQRCVNDDRIYEVTAGGNSGTNPPIHDFGERLTSFGGSTKYRYVSDTVGIVRISSIQDARTATAVAIKPVPQPCVDDATYRWSLGAWSQSRGFPKSIEIFERSFYAAFTESEPSTVWASTLGDFNDFEPSSEADGSFAYALSVNEGNWLYEARRGLFIGALDEVRRGFSSSSQQRAGPTTFDTSLEATDGSASSAPIKPFGNPVVITKECQRVEELRYSLDEDGGKPFELSLPSQHLGHGKFLDNVWQGAPEKVAWYRRGTGDLVAMLYDPEEQVLGWARCSVADGFVEEISNSFDVTTGHNTLLMVVRRVINGQTVRMVESQAVTFGTQSLSDPLHGAIHLFAASVFAPVAPTATFNVPHLVGESVYAWTDVGGFGPLVVSASGDVVLPADVSHAVIGLFDATHELETLNLPANAPDGSPEGRHERVHAGAGVVLHNTAGGTVSTIERTAGSDARQSIAEPLVPQPVAADVVSAVSGLRVIEATSGYADEVSLKFQPEGGAPMTVLGFAADVDQEGP